VSGRDAVKVPLYCSQSCGQLSSLHHVSDSAKKEVTSVARAVDLDQNEELRFLLHNIISYNSLEILRIQCIVS
jgi:hypothetical protein